MARGRKLLASEVEQIRLDYGDPERSVAQAAEAAGVATSTVRALARKHGWERRRAFGDEVDQAARPAGPRQAVEAQLAAIERATSRSVLSLERSLAAGDALDPERTARALAAMTRTIATVKKLRLEREQEFEADDEPPPRTLNELRDELRRHLERISEEDEEESDTFVPEGSGSG